MASIFKRKDAHQCHVEFNGIRGERRRVLAFKDRVASKELGNKIDRAVAIRQGGGVLAGEMLQWLEGLRPDIRDRLAEWGVIDPQRAAAGKLLAEHIEEWGEYMAAKGDTIKHVNESKSLVRRLAEGCNWKYLTDVETLAAQKWLAGIRAGGLSVGRSNSFIRASKHFFNWLQQEKRVSENPLSRVAMLNARVDRRRERRALTQVEIGRLLTAAEAEGQHHSMSGHERALLYRLAIETGLRWSELRSLRRASFDFQGNPASVTIAAEDEKAGRGDTLPLRSELAGDLKAYLSLHLPAARAFPMWQDKGAEMLQRDLAAAGIPIKDEFGRILDFHALRHTFGSMLAAAGVHPKVAQDLMRHSTINLTMDIYTHTALESRMEAVAKLPAFQAQPKEIQGVIAEAGS